mgnify:FL=1
MRWLPLVAAGVGAIVPFSPLAERLGFAGLPARFFVILLAMIAIYLLLVELAKVWFYSHISGPVATGLSSHQLERRHIRRRAIRFVKHDGPGSSALRSKAYDR